jgi:hypothetical protein
LTDLATDAGLYGLGKADGTGDPNEDIWQGMPEFDQPGEDDNSLRVHFGSMDDRVLFGQAIGQGVTDSTRFVWFPPEAKPQRQGVDRFVVEDAT